jgi:hypothetical protein
MSITQRHSEIKSGKQALKAREQAFLTANEQLQGLQQYVQQAGDDELRIDQVERELFTQLLALGRSLLQAFVAGQGDGDVGAEVKLGERTLRRLEEPHSRRYLSIFGELSIARRVYAIRAGQKIEHAPLDKRLGLPEGEFSYVLEDWLQRLCVKESFT